MKQGELFGSEEQQALLNRGQAMARLLREDPRFTYYGRTVGLATIAEGDVDTLLDLVRLQGNSNIAVVPNDAVKALAETLTARGLAPLVYARWQGADTALAAADKAIADHVLPVDLKIERLDADTPKERMASLAELALGCGVLPPSGAVLRGLGHTASCLVAVDPDGQVVCCAAAARFAHDDHPVLSKQAWWGMLATRPERRGQRLALILGALTMRDMADRFGVVDFFTGVEPGNSASEAVCARMGLAVEPCSILGCADPRALSNSRMTK